MFSIQIVSREVLYALLLCNMNYIFLFLYQFILYNVLQNYNDMSNCVVIAFAIAKKCNSPTVIFIFFNSYITCIAFDAKLDFVPIIKVKYLSFSSFREKNYQISLC